jgi:hypothetical protein
MANYGRWSTLYIAVTQFITILTCLGSYRAAMWLTYRPVLGMLAVSMAPSLHVLHNVTCPPRLVYWKAKVDATPVEPLQRQLIQLLVWCMTHNLMDRCQCFRRTFLLQVLWVCRQKAPLKHRFLFTWLHGASFQSFQESTVWTTDWLTDWLPVFVKCRCSYACCKLNEWGSISISLPPVSSQMAVLSLSWASLALHRFPYLLFRSSLWGSTFFLEWSLHERCLQ